MDNAVRQGGNLFPIRLFNCVYGVKGEIFVISAPVNPFLSTPIPPLCLQFGAPSSYVSQTHSLPTTAHNYGTNDNYVHSDKFIWRVLNYLRHFPLGDIICHRSLCLTCSLSLSPLSLLFPLFFSVSSLSFPPLFLRLLYFSLSSNLLSLFFCFFFKCSQNNWNQGVSAEYWSPAPNPNRKKI